MTTYWCVRCISTYIYGHDPITGRGGIVSLCDCGTPTPGYFQGRDYVDPEGFPKVVSETRGPRFFSRIHAFLLRFWLNSTQFRKG